MAQAIGEILAPAVGVALSPMPIVAVILMLFTPRARSNGGAFAAGWMIGIIAVVSIVLLVADPSGVSADQDDPSTVAAILHLALGAGLMGLAARQWSGRPKGDTEAEMPSWMQSIDKFTPVMALGFGALMSGVNPKNLLLNVSAGGSIARADAGASGAIVALVIFTLLASSTTAGIVVWALLAGERANQRLEQMKSWLVANNTVVMVVLLAILGVSQIGKGIGLL